MRNDPLLVYKGRQQDWEPGRDYGTRYLVFRRTNLPCLRCGNPIKQRRQTTMSNEPSPTDRTLKPSTQTVAKIQRSNGKFSRLVLFSVISWIFSSNAAPSTTHEFT